jgi:hypothetical protein
MKLNVNPSPRQPSQQYGAEILQQNRNYEKKADNRNYNSVKQIKRIVDSIISRQGQEEERISEGQCKIKGIFYVYNPIQNMNPYDYNAKQFWAMVKRTNIIYIRT